ncbi:MAG: hypothetical protein ACE5JZ_13765 [Kiloniellales bacterium]
MRSLGYVAMTCAAGLVLAACAANMPGGVTLQDSSLGRVFADEKGMTLYTFDKDEMGMSNCYGECAEYWPPLMASDDAMAVGDFTIVTRKDGSKQWAVNGKPLYTWVQDTKPGDVTGDGFKDVWHVAVPPSGGMAMGDM